MQKSREKKQIRIQRNKRIQGIIYWWNDFLSFFVSFIVEKVELKYADQIKKKSKTTTKETIKMAPKERNIAMMGYRSVGKTFQIILFCVWIFVLFFLSRCSNTHCEQCNGNGVIFCEHFFGLICSHSRDRFLFIKKGDNNNNTNILCIIMYSIRHCFCFELKMAREEKKSKQTNSKHI